MTPRYKPEDREYALKQLRVNQGDIALTSRQLGISVATLYRWQKTNSDSQFSLSSSLSLSSTAPPIPSDDIPTFRYLKEHMVRGANALSLSLIEAIPEAALGQRVASLAQLTDMIIKLSTQLSEDVQIEYVLTDDVEPVDDIYTHTEI